MHVANAQPSTDGEDGGYNGFEEAEPAAPSPEVENAAAEAMYDDANDMDEAEADEAEADQPDLENNEEYNENVDVDSDEDY